MTTQTKELSAVGRFRHGDRWGDWELDAKRLCLVFQGVGHPGYEVNIEEIRDSAGMLDWLSQIQGKAWATPQVRADLHDALDDLFDPQANLCSDGRAKQIENPLAFLRSRITRKGN